MASSPTSKYGIGSIPGVKTGSGTPRTPGSRACHCISFATALSRGRSSKAPSFWKTTKTENLLRRVADDNCLEIHRSLWTECLALCSNWSTGSYSSVGRSSQFASSKCSCPGLLVKQAPTGRLPLTESRFALGMVPCCQRGQSTVPIQLLPLSRRVVGSPQPRIESFLVRLAFHQSLLEGESKPTTGQVRTNELARNFSRAGVSQRINSLKELRGGPYRRRSHSGSSECLYSGWGLSPRGVMPTTIAGCKPRTEFVPSRCGAPASDYWRHPSLDAQSRLLSTTNGSMTPLCREQWTFYLFLSSLRQLLKEIEP